MTIVAFVGHWWNLPFLVMLGAALIYFVLQRAGIARPKDVDAEHETVADVLGFFGISPVSSPRVWLTLLTSAGIAGLILNWVMARQRPSYPGWFFPVALVTALVIGLIAVRVFARAPSKVV